MIEVMGPLVIAVIAAFLIWQLFMLVGDMAQDRGHDPWPWWLLSLAWSPVGSIVVLWIFFDIDKSEAEKTKGQ